MSALTLDPVAFPNGDALKNNAVLGRLNVTKSLGDTDGDGDHDQLYTLGGRSFSIWTEDGRSGVRQRQRIRTHHRRNPSGVF